MVNKEIKSAEQIINSILNDSANPCSEKLICLIQQRNESLRNYNWQSAIEQSFQILELYQQERDMFLVAKTQVDLSKLFHATLQHKEALTAAADASASARKFKESCRLQAKESDRQGEFVSGSEAKSSAFLMLVAWIESMTLENEALRTLDSHDAAGAIRIIHTALNILPESECFAFMRGSLLIARSRCLIVSGRFDAAEQDIIVAKPLLDRHLSDNCATRQVSVRASWWEIRGCLHHIHGDLDHEVQALQNAVDLRRQAIDTDIFPNPYELDALAGALEGFAKALFHNANNEACSCVLVEARQIRKILLHHRGQH